MHPTLILASASPQRLRLLKSLGLELEVVLSNIDEAAHPETKPAARARELAEQKATAVAALYPDAFVIGSDTLVEAADGMLLEKPSDAVEARSMLERQQGRMSVVHSGVCVCAPTGGIFSDVNSTAVHFAMLSQEMQAWWHTTGLWQDRSGAFQIDGPGQLLIERIEGDWTGVVGLPLFLTSRLLVQAGFPLQEQMNRSRQS